MRTKTLLLFWSGLILAGLLSGCSTPTLNPVYSDDTVSEQPEMVGTWKLESEESTFRINSLGGTNYRLTITSEEGQSPKVMTFDLHFADLGDDLIVADIEPTLAKRHDFADEYGDLVITTHFVLPLSVSEDGKSLTIWMLNDGHLKTALESGAIETPWALRNDETVLLTGTTAQLQEFMRSQPRDERIFDEETLLRVEDP